MNDKFSSLANIVVLTALAVFAVAVFFINRSMVINDTKQAKPVSDVEQGVVDENDDENTYTATGNNEQTQEKQEFEQEQMEPSEPTPEPMPEPIDEPVSPEPHPEQYQPQSPPQVSYDNPSYDKDRYGEKNKKMTKEDKIKMKNVKRGKM